jgi:predicted lipid carrier protein YhbT
MSPVLFAGLLARPLPLAPLNIFLGILMRHMHSNHQSVFDRMDSIEDPTFLIIPTDLPFAFHMDASASKPRLRAVSKQAEVDAAATIKGPLSVLISLLEGKIDGDALFFTRTLTVKGDTEAILALRNAVDSTEINLAEEARSFAGPFSMIGTHISGLIVRAWQTGQADLELLIRSMTAKQDRKLASHDTALERIEGDLKKLVKQSQRRRKLTS